MISYAWYKLIIHVFFEIGDYMMLLIHKMYIHFYTVARL